MSFPVAVLDRRLALRRKCAELCMVYFNPEDGVATELSQFDVHGARLRLLAPTPEVAESLLIVLADGRELFAEATWRIDDMIGVRRLPRTAARARAFVRAEAA